MFTGVQDDINTELEAVSTKLDTSKALQSKFDRWAGNWLGGKKSKAMREAAAEIALRNQEEHSKVKEVFQHEKYDGIARVWKRAGLVLCNDPCVSCDDVFDPAIQESVENSPWSVDFSLSGIDAEGWTYAYDFASLNRSGAGDMAPKWNSYVRRRKWRYVDKGGSGSAALNECVPSTYRSLSLTTTPSSLSRRVKDRNEARHAKAAAASGSSKAAGKIGYVPRNQQASTLTASGLTSASMVRGKQPDQDLDEESAAGLKKLQESDAEIDAGLDAIGRTIDSLTNIASTMKEEVPHSAVCFALRLPD